MELDPCPAGYRVPSLIEWEGILKNNTSKKVGSWKKASTNYENGRFFGRKLFLPAAGYRDYYYGALYGRDDLSLYWSSAEDGSASSWSLTFNSGGAGTSSNSRANGQSVRCIAE